MNPYQSPALSCDEAEPSSRLWLVFAPSLLGPLVCNALVRRVSMEAAVLGLVVIVALMCVMTCRSRSHYVAAKQGLFYVSIPWAVCAWVWMAIRLKYGFLTAAAAALQLDAGWLSYLMIFSSLLLLLNCFIVYGMRWKLQRFSCC